MVEDNSEHNYEMQVVKELKGGKLLYPRNIPQDRGNTANIAVFILLAVLLAVCIQLVYKGANIQKALQYTYCALVTNNLILVICYVTLRCFHLMEEFNHVRTRYDGNIVTVLKAGMGFNTTSIVLIVVSLVSFVALSSTIGCPLKYIWNYDDPSPYLLTLGCSVLLMSIVNINECRLNTALTIQSMNGLDYGSSMAYSYFYGYLNIILPATGTENKGMREKIELYESNENVTIPVKKLFILIPTSLRIPPDLSEATYGWMEGAKPLESLLIHRAGVKQRVYRNTVYKIHPGGHGQGHRPVYVITEGATPLQTFYEVLQHTGRDSVAYQDYHKEIIASFYTTLRTIIRNRPDCRDVCELVYYEDMDPDERRVNVAKILLQRISDEASWAS